MEQNFQANGTDNANDVIEGQIREMFGRVVYSHKTHEKCADIMFDTHRCIKLIQIILSALVTTSIFVKLFGENNWSLGIAAILSTVLFGLNTYMKDYNLGEITQKHSSAAAELWNVRETYLSMLTDLKAGTKSIDAILIERDELQKKLFAIYSGSPRTLSKAYRKAVEGLQKNEELTFSDAELDLLLPKKLRKNI